MKKLSKVATAAGVGVMLLVGGGSTLASWTDEADSGSVQVQAGTLDLGQLTMGKTGWTVTKDGSTTAEAFDASSTPLAPGDSLTITEEVPVTLAGHLAATFVAAPQVTTTAVVDPATGSEVTRPQDSALAEIIGAGAVSEVLSVTGTELTLTTTDAGHVLTGSGSGNVVVRTTVRFPFDGSAADNDAKLGALHFGLGYTLTQLVEAA